MLSTTLDPADGLWIAWPKKAAKIEGDLTFDGMGRAARVAGADGALVVVSKGRGALSRRVRVELR